MPTRDSIIKQVREQGDYAVKQMSDDDIISFMKEAQPNLKIEEEKERGFLDGGLKDLGKSVLKGADNYFADATNLTLGKITGEEYKPIGVNLGLRDDDYGDGGLVGRTAKRGGEFFENTWEDAKSNQGLAQNVYNMGGEGIKFATGTFGDIVGSGISTVVPDDLEKEVQNIVQKGLTETKIGQNIASLVTEYDNDMKFLKENDPQAYRKYRATFGYIEGGFEAIGLKKVNGIYRMGSGELKHLPNFNIKAKTQDITKKVLDAKNKMAESIKNVKIKNFSKVKEIVGDTLQTQKEYQKAMSPSGKTFIMEKTPTLNENISDKIFAKTNEKLVGQSIKPKLTKEKSLKARLNLDKDYYKSVVQMYDDYASGIIKTDINDMGGAVEGTKQALKHYGKKIGELTKIDEEIDVTKLVEELKKELGKKESIFADTKGKIQDYVNKFEEVGNILAVKEIQPILSNIKSNIYSDYKVANAFAQTNTGRKMFEFIEKLDEKFDTAINIISGDSKELKLAKANYRKYKRIQKDMVDSYVHVQRDLGKGLGEVAGSMGAVYHVVNNPSLTGVVKGAISKGIGSKIGYYRSRQGSWEALIRNLDRKAIKEYKIHKSKLKDTPKETDTKIPKDKIIKDDDIIEFVQDVKKEIENSQGDVKKLKEIREGIMEQEDLPRQYKEFFEDKLDFMIKEAENFEKEMQTNLDLSSLSEHYGEGLTKAFNQLEGIKARTKSTKGGDKMTKIEFEKSPAYKNFSEQAKEFIGENPDLTIQEVFEQMQDMKNPLLNNVSKKYKKSPMYYIDLEEAKDYNKQISDGYNIVEDKFQTKNPDSGMGAVGFRDGFIDSGSKYGVENINKETFVGLDAKPRDYANLSESDFLNTNKFVYQLGEAFQEIKNKLYNGINNKEARGLLDDLGEQMGIKNIRQENTSVEELTDKIRKGIVKINDRMYKEQSIRLKNKAKFQTKDIPEDNIKSIDPKTGEGFDKDGNSLGIVDERFQTKDMIDEKKINYRDKNFFTGYDNEGNFKAYTTMNFKGKEIKKDITSDILLKDLEKLREPKIKQNKPKIKQKSIINDNIKDIENALDELKEYGEYWDKNDIVHYKESIPEFEEKLKILKQPITKENVIEADRIEKISEIENNIEPIRVYRGRPKGETGFLVEKEKGVISTSGGNLYGISTSTDRSIANDFAMAQGGEVISFEIEPHSKILNMKGEYFDNIDPGSLKELHNRGYDVIIDTDNIGGEKEIRILNEDVIIDKNKFQKTKSSGQGVEITQKEAKKIVEKYFKPDEVGVEFVERITTPGGLEAFGKYRNKLITFAKNPIDSTPEHEVLHAFFDTVTSKENKIKVLEEVKMKENFKTDLDAEEWLADNFVKYVRQKENLTLTEKVKDYFKNIYNNFKSFFIENPNKTEELFNELMNHKKSDISKIGIGIIGEKNNIDNN